MEDSESPKANAETVNNELEVKATELAKVTRERGMGQLQGKFPPRLLKAQHELGGFTWIGQFIQGDEIPADDRGALMITKNISSDIIQHGFEQRQVWQKSQYVPVMETIRVKGFKDVQGERSTMFGLRKKKTIEKKPVWRSEKSDIPITYHGKRGEKDWINYDYSMIIEYPYDPRRTHNTMTIAVPPDIAAQIDEQVEKNVYFPDAFLKALYPGYVGPDSKQDIKRAQATELQTIDATGKPIQAKVRKYPNTIPY